ncbi:hypothetical protein B7P43_G07167 [Cryptotermes secundus]|uniref:Dynein axonemal assembly factor 11-like CS domain-containing protein n=2 Tax=Cryptotermes secundus TaxID=105785 RepID=A0A2J7PJN9_9NEOP|nr:hypothetical protein B7P43_G07167 [Cryptotermes secundus]PNF16557.1 hypothetical protein B7P43_G07167 [Cryptotermes secundus]PNF16558.1 hypothetical protein B7P43_G07167 [Cryptotermes secundus]
MQEYNEVKKLILSQEQEYKGRRLAQKQQAERRAEEEETNYAAAQDKPEEEKLQEFWSQVSEHSPETRLHIAAQVLKQQEEKQKGLSADSTRPPKREYKLFNAVGKPLNVNEAKIPFLLTEDDKLNSLVLDIAVYKYLDTSLLDVDIQPTYVKVLIKGKIFQIVFPEEINTESSRAERSQTTGHLVLTMPKVNGEVKPKTVKHTPTTRKDDQTRNYSNTIRREMLEIGRSEDMDFSRIVKLRQYNQQCNSARDGKGRCEAVTDFVDDPEVPPLE